MRLSDSVGYHGYMRVERERNDCSVSPYSLLRFQIDVQGGRVTSGKTVGDHRLFVSTLAKAVPGDNGFYELWLPIGTRDAAAASATGSGVIHVRLRVVSGSLSWGNIPERVLSQRRSAPSRKLRGV